jgi:hypothetical protein
MYHWFLTSTLIPQSKMNLIVAITSRRAPTETNYHLGSVECVYAFAGRKLRVMYGHGDTWPVQAEIDYA